jgi:hypothetical protein
MRKNVKYVSSIILKKLINIVKKLKRLKQKNVELIREQDTAFDEISSLKSTINDTKYFEKNGVLVDIESLTIDEGSLQIEE